MWNSLSNWIVYANTTSTFNTRLDKSSAVAEMGTVATIDMGRKDGRGAAVPFRTELGPRLIQCGLGRGLHPYQVASSSIQPFGHNKHGAENWVVVGVPSVLGVAGSLSNTKSIGPSLPPYQVPS